VNWLVAVITLLVFIVVIILSILIARFITSLYINCLSLIMNYLLRKIGFFNVGNQGRNGRTYCDPKINPINISKRQHNSLHYIANESEIPTIGNTPFNHPFCEIPISKYCQNKDGEGCNQNSTRNIEGFLPIRHCKSIIKRLVTKCK